MSYCFVHTKLGSVHTTQVGKGGALIWLNRLVEKAQEVSRTAGLAPNGSRELSRQRAAHSNIYVTMGNVNKHSGRQARQPKIASVSASEQGTR